MDIVPSAWVGCCNKDDIFKIDTMQMIKMSHTLRIYNNPRLKKAQRFNLDDGAIHLGAGIPYTIRSYICMGRCKMCRDHNRDTRLIRKRTKEQFRFELKSELKSELRSELRSESKSESNVSKNENQLEQSS